MGVCDPMKIIYYDHTEKNIIERECDHQEEFNAGMDWIENGDHLILMSFSGANLYKDKPITNLENFQKFP